MVVDIREKLFHENFLFSREDILMSLELFIEHEELNEEPSYPEKIVENRIKLTKKFAAAIQKSKLPALTELWWFYEYNFLGNSMVLNLCQVNEIEVENDELGIVTSSLEHALMNVECGYLTVEQYASLLDMKPVTVREWIRRGKLRHAKKVDEEWLIPDTEDKPHRGFTSVQYIVDKGSRIESAEFPMLAVSDSVMILQDRENKSNFLCYLDNAEEKFQSTLELTRSEVERLEHTIIESGKAKVEGDIQYVPNIRDLNDSEL